LSLAARAPVVACEIVFEAKFCAADSVQHRLRLIIGFVPDHDLMSRQNVMTSHASVVLTTAPVTKGEQVEMRSAMLAPIQKVHVNPSHVNRLTFFTVRSSIVIVPILWFHMLSGL